MNGRTMNYNNYFDFVKTMADPIMPSQLPKRKLNLSAIARYAKEHDICFSNMSEEEKEAILKEVK